MIRSLATEPDGTPLVLFGLTAEDLKQMVKDEQPIIVNLRRLVPDQTMELPDVQVALFYASEAAVEAMKQTQQSIEGEPDEHDQDRPRRRFGRRVPR